jgi:hypothetical protein
MTDRGLRRQDARNSTRYGLDFSLIKFDDFSDDAWGATADEDGHYGLAVAL